MTSTGAAGQVAAGAGELIAGIADDGRLVVTHRLLDGCTFTHRLDLEEVVCEWLHVHPDFTPLAAFADRFALADGSGELRVLTGAALDETGLAADEAVLAGPPGWLGAITTGGGVALRWTDGAVEVSATDIPEAPATASEPVAALLDAARTAAEPPSVVELVLRILSADHDRFSLPGAPIADLLASAHLAVAGGRVVDADRADRDRTKRTRTQVAIPGVTTDGVAALQRLWAAYAAYAASDRIDAAPDLAAALGNPEAAGAFAEQLFGGEAVGSDDGRRFVDALAGGVSGPAGVALLVARAAEADGLTDDAEAAVRDTLRRNPGFTPALLDAAWFASDRGEAGRALALLMAAKVERNDPELLLLRRFTVPGPDHVGRNAACPCGSGRKYKHCHLRTYGHRLSERFGWLYAKATAFAQRPPQRRALFTLARAYAQLPPDSDDTARLLSAACEPILLDLHLFDGGAVGGFVKQRGSLLPDDERSVAELWIDARVRLWRRDDSGKRYIDEVDGDEVDGDKGDLPARFLAVALPNGEGSARRFAGQPLGVPAAVATELAAIIGGGADAPRLATFLGERLGWTSPPDDDN